MTSETIQDVRFSEVNQKPAVTREQYDAARAVLDALPSGVYMKCEGCRQWKRDGNFALRNQTVYCEACA